MEFVLLSQTCKTLYDKDYFVASNPEFLREVENNVKPLDIEKKQPALMAALVPLQMKTTEAYGMPGEEGYVLLQAEMMKNMADPEIQHNMAAAMQAILRTADIPTGM